MAWNWQKNFLHVNKQTAFSILQPYPPCFSQSQNHSSCSFAACFSSVECCPLLDYIGCKFLVKFGSIRPLCRVSPPSGNPPLCACAPQVFPPPKGDIWDFIDSCPHTPNPQDGNQMEISRHINSLPFQITWFQKTGNQVFPTLALKEQSVPSQPFKSILSVPV